MINYDLKRIKAIIFDVDGVLSANVVPVDDNGQPRRTANIKDGYALQQAVKQGLRLAIITGGRVESIRTRYAYLGIQDIYLACSMKLEAYEQFLYRYELTDDEVLYMGDDIPDYEVMQRCGCPCCPADAAVEIKAISRYVSHLRGGEGCVRDVLEQVMRVQGKWMNNKEAFGW